MKPKISLNLDTTFIKLIAAAAMLCDHTGKIFFNDVIILQIIGRISFPIFAYCTVVGALYTRDMKNYMLRLGLLAIATQFIYIQAFIPGASNPATYIVSKNILFTLLTGLIAINGIKDKNWLLLGAGLFIAAFGRLDYGFFGVLLIISFYLFRENTMVSFIFISIQLAMHFFGNSRSVDVFGLSLGLKGFAVLSLPFIYIKTNVHPKINKYLFYIFYPAHLLALYIAQILV